MCTLWGPHPVDRLAQLLVECFCRGLILLLTLLAAVAIAASHLDVCLVGQLLVAEMITSRLARGLGFDRGVVVSVAAGMGVAAVV